MKKHIFAILAVAASLMTVNAAQVIKPYIMRVNTSDGQTAEYAFSALPKATFSGGTMTIKALASPAVEYAMDNVESITLVDDNSGVTAITNDSDKLRFTITDSEIVIDGMEADSRADVYDANGRHAASAISDTNGHATVNVSNIGKGVYVVSTTTHSFKFIK